MTVLRYSLLIAAALLAVTGAALKAQPSKGPPNALQGFSQNRDQPVHIEAATLEVRDKDKMATFSGDVRVTQGDTNMRCKTLMVFYEQDDANGDNEQEPEGGDPGSRRSAAHQAAGSAWRGRGDAEGPNRDRRNGRVRHEEQHRDADRQRWS